MSRIVDDIAEIKASQVRMESKFDAILNGPNGLVADHVLIKDRQNAMGKTLETHSRLVISGVATFVLSAFAFIWSLITHAITIRVP